MSDTAALAAITFGAVSLARYARTVRPRWLWCSAGSLAVAVLIRWASALVALPLTACAILVLARRRPAIALVHGAVASLIVLAVLSPLLGPAFAHVTGRAAPGASFVGDLQAMGWDPLNAFRHEWVDIDGFLSFRLSNSLYYLLAPARWFFFTPLLAPFILVGLINVARQRDAVSVLLLVAWPLVVFGFIAGVHHQNPRLALPYLPPLAVLLAMGFAEVWWRVRSSRRLLLGLVLAAVSVGWR